jgi:hypothetical protein
MTQHRDEVRGALVVVAVAIAGCSFNSNGLGGGRGTGPSSGSAGTSGDTGTSLTGASTGETADATTPSEDTSTPATEGTTGAATESTSTGTDPSVDATSATTDDPQPPCAVDNGGCAAEATCTADGDAVTCACNPGFVGDGLVCATAPSFETLRVNLGCDAHDDCGGPVTCTTAALVQADAPLGGDPDVAYEVTLRIRGVVEVTTYDDGDCDGFWCVGGTGVGAPWNEVTLRVDAPLADYHPNAGEAGTLSLFALDEERTVTMMGGAELTLRMDGNGTCTIANDDDVVVPDIPPAPQAFDGQFVQIDLVSATVAR